MKTYEIVVCALFAALMAIGANVSPFLTIGGVPVTLQLMFAILAGGLLGSRLGSFSMMAYVCIGLAGAPVFAQFKGGPASILSPTFGFVLSFIAVAYATGKLLSEPSKKAAYLYTGAVVILLNYVIGTHYMYAAFRWWAEAPQGFSYAVAWSWMAAYLPLDLAVIALSLASVPKIRLALSKRSVYIIKE
ncbi:biotin transporter BioY [Pseudobacillus badius]|uniref:biotin transporter BioY n=1 Tax=Bacillus badius TaxID=1455 RepID=UPI001CBDB1C5|nr:biotin transporter BioY [Bacillus badius]MED0665401.1 biotin transporter BioY [Bacillus badius]UAT31232.1 biotin transporter BioY [Bacillus badius]GLY11586.1 BioY family transporter [Bacillus badius]